MDHLGGKNKVIYCKCLGCGNKLAVVESLDRLPWRHRARMSKWKRIKCNSCGIELFISRYQKRPKDRIWVQQKYPLQSFCLQEPTIN